MSDTVSIRITADTSGVEAGIQQVRGDLGELKSTVQAAADSMSGGFAGMRGAVERSAQSMDALTASMHGLRPQEIVSGLNEVTAALRHNSAALQEMASKSGEGKSGFGKLVEGIKGAAGVAGELYEAGKQAAQAIVAMGESSEKVSVLSKQLGMSTHQVQQLQAMAQATGTDFTKLSQSTAALDKNFSKSPDTFKKLGVDIKAGSDQMTILTTVADKFAKTTDGPQKTAMAIKLMGQAGAEAIPFLNQGGAAISALAQKTDAYGAANDGAVASGKKLGEAVNEAQIAWSGVTQTLTAALAPVATEIVDRFNQLAQAFTQSYNSGGLVKTIFDEVSTAIEGVGEILNTLGTAFADLWQITGASGVNWSAIQHGVMDAVVTAVKAVIAAVVALAIGFKIRFEEIVGYALGWWGKLKEAFDFASLGIEAIKKALQVFGQVAYDALTLNWGSIASDWDKGMADIDATVRKRGAQIVADAKKTSDDAKRHLRAAAEAAAQGRGMLADIMAKTPPPPSTGVDQTTPITDDTTNSGRGRGGGSGPRGSSGGGPAKPQSRMNEWQAALDEKKLAIQAEADAEGKFRQISLQEEHAYWANILATAKMSKDEEVAVKRKATETSIAMHEEEFQSEVDKLRNKLDLAHGNLAEETKIGKAIVDATKEHYGEESKQAKDTERQITEYLRREADERRRIQDDYFKHVADMRHSDIDDAQAQAEYLNQMGALSDAQLLQQQKKFENDRFQIDSDELIRKLNQLKADPTTNPDVIKGQDAEIERLAKQHQLRLNDISRKASLQRSQIERQAINQIASGWSQNIAKMLTLQQGFAATVKGLWQTVQQAIGDAIAKIIEQWLAKELTALAIKLGILKTDGQSTITTEAAKAGAGGTASMAAAPFPWNLSAPGFGAAMSAAAASYGTMAGFDVGAYDLSRDGIGMLHKGETIIPADQAGGWRNVMGLFASMPTFGVPSVGFAAGANSNAPFAANDQAGASGGYHYHDHTASGLSEAQIIANRNAFAKAMKMAHREGKLGFSLQR
jgi:hypothetical protein